MTVETDDHGASRSRLRVFLVGLAAAVVVAATGCSSPVRVEGSRTLGADWRDGATLLVTTDNGEIGVARLDEEGDADGRLRIEARLRATGATEAEAASRLAATQVVVDWREDGVLVIRPDFPGGRREEDRASFTVAVPADARLDRLSLRTGSGHVSVDGTDGTALVTIGLGSLRLSSHDGPAFASLGTGDTVARDVRGELQVVAGMGSIDVAVADGVEAPLTLRSTRGNLRVALPASATGSLELNAVRGGIDADDLGDVDDVAFRGRFATIRFSEDGPASSAVTLNGVITVERRAPTAAPAR